MDERPYGNSALQKHSSDVIASCALSSAGSTGDEDFGISHFQSFRSLSQISVYTPIRAKLMSALTKNFGSAFQALSQRSGPRRPQRLSYAPLRQLPKSSCFPEALITKARQCEFPFSAIDTGDSEPDYLAQAVPNCA
ncbi:MAG: hypothetical protein QOH31_2914 [Verrucomicrobiota bacterium]